MAPLPPPQLRITTKYVQSNGPVDRSLPLCLIGGLASVIRFDDLNSDDGLLGVYNPSPSVVSGIAQSLYGWPNLPVGNTVEQTAAELWVKNGLWRYFSDNDTDAKVGADRSSIVAENGVRFGTNTAGNSTIVDGGVKVGDYVRLVANKISSGTETLLTQVIGVKAESTASSHGSAILSSTAFANQSAAASVVSSPASSMTAAASATNYNGLNSYPNETYTVTVLVGGAPGDAIIQVRSASGTDDVDSLTTGAEDTFFNLTSRGLQVKFTDNGANTTLTVGQVYVFSASDLVAARTVTVSGTYTGSQDRTYIIEVVRGDLLASNLVQVRVRSTDGTDQLAAVTVAQASPGVSASFAIGSYGLTGVINAASGVVVGDKWSVTASASGTGALTTIELSGSFSSDVVVGSTSVNLTYDFYRVRTEEVPAQLDSSVFFATEATQLSVRGGITLAFDDITFDGVPVDCPLYGSSTLESHSLLYVSYRSWYPRFTAPIQILASADLSATLSGPMDADNILKKGVAVARLTAATDSIFALAVGDPTDMDEWESALTTINRNPTLYQYVPLTSDPEALTLVAGAVTAANGSTSPTNRVGWMASTNISGQPILDSTTTSNDTHALAVVEDNSLASGTQYTKVRITSANANLQTLGVRVGDKLRYDFDVDSRGVTTYETRTITQILSGTSVIIDAALPENGIAKRVEIHRVFNAADKVEYYASEAGAWGSRDIRYVLAPSILVGGETLPSYFAAALVAGMRTSLLPHQPLSTVAVNGLQAVYGIETLSDSDLNELAGAGCMILSYDYTQRAVTVRHGVTTGETDIIPVREESMVTALHVALRSIRATLRPLVAQVLIPPTASDGRVEELVRATMDSIRGELQTAYYTPQLGGLISDLIIDYVGPSEFQDDELVVRGRMFFGTPGNVIGFEHSVN